MNLGYESGFFSWDTTAATPNAGLFFLVRISCNQDYEIADTSESLFTLHNQVFFYYVNDDSTESDVYCTAAGDDANDGLTPATPKATIQAIIDTYDLGPGDVVYIDTGIYVLSENIVVGPQDSGNADYNVTFTGSTHPSGTLIDRNNTAWSGSYAFHLTGGGYVALNNLRFTGGFYGIRISADYCSISNCRVYGNYHGIRISSDYVTIGGNIIDRNTYRGIILWCKYGEITNNTICLNGDDQVYIEYAEDYLSLCNNIIWADGAGDYCVYVVGYRSDTIDLSDYNDLYATNGAYVGYYMRGQRTTLSDWQNETGFDTHSISYDPLFADPDGTDDVAGNQDDDLHLQSTTGSWHGGTWLADASDSPCMDAGDPHDDASLEPIPSGDRINMGAHGGTGQASKSFRKLALLAPNGGELWSLSGTIRWNVNENLWQSEDTVSIYYSSDGGDTWFAISGAANLLGTTEEYEWNLLDIPRGDQYRVRVECDQDLAATGSSQTNFTIAGKYFVNDADTTGDEYCTNPGLPGNNGLTPSTPKDSLQGILDDYDLEPGDTIFVDSGTYGLSDNIVVGTADGGSALGQMQIVGVKGKTILDRGAPNSSGSACIELSGADYVSLANLHFRNAYLLLPKLFGRKNPTIIDFSSMAKAL